MYEGEGEIKVRIMLLSDGGHIMHTNSVLDTECIVNRQFRKRSLRFTCVDNL